MGRKPIRRRSNPSFFKVLLGDFSKRLRIPPDFIKHFKGTTLPTNSILTSPNGKRWRVTMKKIKNNWFFQSGWPLFVRYHSLKVGEFLVFSYNGDSKFSVKIFDKSACEKEAPSAKGNSDHEPISHVKKEEQREPMAEFAKKAVISGGSIRPKRRNMPANMIERNGMLEAVSLCKTEFPHFTQIWRPTRKYQITVPKALAAENGLVSKESTVLRDPHGRSWPVKIRHRKDDRVEMTGGWSEFWKANNLVEGDACVFELVRGMGNTICVHIFRAAVIEPISCSLIPATAMIAAPVDLSTCAIDDETKTAANPIVEAIKLEE